MTNLLEVAVAQFKIEDLADKELKKLDKTLEKTITKFIKAEKQAKKTDGQLSKTGKGFRSSLSKVSGFGGRAIQGASAGGSGGLASFGSSFGSIPFVGALIAGSLVALNSVKNKFIQGVSLKQDLLSFASNFRQSFKEQSDSVIRQFSGDGFFRKEDVEASLTALTDAGISPEAIKRNADILKSFTQAQGLTSVGQGVQSLIGGNIKAGRGVKQEDILRIQALAPLLGNVATAEQGFSIIASILNENSETIRENAEKTKADLKEITQLQNRITDTQQRIALKGQEAGESVFNAVVKTEEAVADIQSSLTAGADKIIKNIQKVTGADDGKAIVSPKNRPPRRRARGGAVLQGQSYIVGEETPEVFIPSVNGTIQNKSQVNQSMKSSSGGAGAGVNNTFSFQITMPVTIPENIGQDLKRGISKALDDLANTKFRAITGLPLKRA